VTILKQKCSCGNYPATNPNPKCERCKMVWTIAVTKSMRQRQRDYFNSRTSESLQLSKNLERIVDNAIAKLENQQGELF